MKKRSPFTRVVEYSTKIKNQSCSLKLVLSVGYDTRIRAVRLEDADTCSLMVTVRAFVPLPNSVAQMAYFILIEFTVFEQIFKHSVQRIHRYVML